MHVKPLGECCPTKQPSCQSNALTRVARLAIAGHSYSFHCVLLRDLRFVLISTTTTQQNGTCARLLPSVASIRGLWMNYSRAYRFFGWVNDACAL